MKLIPKQVQDVVMTCPDNYSRLDIAKRIQSRFPDQNWNQSKAQAFLFIMYRSTGRLDDAIVRKRIQRPIFLPKRNLDKIIGKDKQETPSIMEDILRHINE